MLKIRKGKFHKVASGQTAKAIAAAYHVGLYALIKENGLVKEVEEGQVLRLPKGQGNAYIVQSGDSKTLLCATKEGYEKSNGKYIYPGLKVIL